MHKAIKGISLSLFLSFYWPNSILHSVMILRVYTHFFRPTFSNEINRSCLRFLAIAYLSYIFQINNVDDLASSYVLSMDEITDGKYEQEYASKNLTISCKPYQWCKNITIEIQSNYFAVSFFFIKFTASKYVLNVYLKSCKQRVVFH